MQGAGEDGQDFDLYAGDTKLIRFKIKQKGTPLDLTDAEGKWWAAESNAADVLPVIEKATGGNGVTFEQDDDDQWYMNVRLTEADTIDLTPNAYYHEALVVITDEQERDTIASGTMVVRASIIRP